MSIQILNEIVKKYPILNDRWGFQDYDINGIYGFVSNFEDFPNKYEIWPTTDKRDT